MRRRNTRAASFFALVDIIILSTIILSFILGLVTIPHIVHLSHQLHLYDQPDKRKIHSLPIPRLGGVAFLPTVIVTMSLILVILLRLQADSYLLWNSAVIQHFLAFLAGSVMLYSIGLYDDVHGVSYKKKFLLQILAATLLCVSGLWVADFSYVFFIREVPWWVGMPATVLAVVYVTNAINLIDGIDGLAAGLAIIALIVIAALNIYLGHLAWAMIATATLGVLCAFFYFNVFGKRDKTFMGDAGSLTLGYTLAFLILHFWQRDPVWNRQIHNVGIIALSTLIIPMFDVVRVMMSRLRDKRDPFLPDKNHIHHKLLRTGMSPTWVMITLLCLSSAFIFINYLTASYLSQTLMIIFDILGFCLMHMIINIFIWKKERATGIEWDRIMQSPPQNT